MGGGPGGGPYGGLGISGCITPGWPARPGSPGVANGGRISGGGRGGGWRDIPGGNTSGCKDESRVGPATGGCCLGGGGGGTILERSLVAEKLLMSESDGAPSNWLLADFGGSPGGGGGGGSMVGTCIGEILILLNTTSWNNRCRALRFRFKPSKYIVFDNHKYNYPVH